MRGFQLLRELPAFWGAEGSAKNFRFVFSGEGSDVAARAPGVVARGMGRSSLRRARAAPVDHIASGGQSSVSGAPACQFGFFDIGNIDDSRARRNDKGEPVGVAMGDIAIAKISIGTFDHASLPETSPNREPELPIEENESSVAATSGNAEDSSEALPHA